MYALLRGVLLCLNLFLSVGVGAFIASVPATIGFGDNEIQPTPMPAPISSMIAPTGTSPPLLRANPAPHLSSAPSQSSIGAVDPSVLGGVPRGLRSLVVGGLQSDGCKTSDTIVGFPSVDIFYWPSISPNTDCLSTITEQLPSPPQPSGMISPSVYLVFPPASCYDGCGKLLNAVLGAGTSTDSYAVEEMSTLQDIPGATPAAQVFNFNDLPCPPPAIAEELDPGSAYRPVVELNWTRALSIAADSQKGVQDFNPYTEVLNPTIADPTRPVVQVNAINGPGQGVPP